jgi:hypothetical protein
MTLDLEQCIKSGVEQALKECELTIGMTLKEAVERQIPKTPLNKSLEYDGEYGYCPCCNSILAEYTDFKRCRECGQALKW